MSSATSVHDQPTNTPPALLGGAPAITIDAERQARAFRWPIITDEDEAAVLRVLRTGELSIHAETQNLEADYRAWLGVRHAIAHNNGTGAIHAAMHAFGLEPGDEVIVPSGTWWASVMPVLHQGAIPVFAEMELQTLGLDPADVEAKITDRTKAIVAVHLFGMPSNMDALMAIAKRHGLRVLEDASHAHGATYHGRPIGTIADAAVFSMQANKLLPSAEGGMLVTNDDAIAERTVRYGHYERLLNMTDSPQRRFAATGFGHKFRMSPLSAAVARTQLRHLADRNARRNANCIRVSQRLEALGFEPFLAPSGVDRVYFEFIVHAPPARLGLPAPRLAEALQAEGARVEAPRYPLLHQQPVFTDGTWAKIARVDAATAERVRYDPSALPRTIAGNAELLRLPTFPHDDDELIDQYLLAFEKVVASAHDLREANA